MLADQRRPAGTARVPAANQAQFDHIEDETNAGTDQNRTSIHCQLLIGYGTLNSNSPTRIAPTLVSPNLWIAVFGKKSLVSIPKRYRQGGGDPEKRISP